MPITRISSCSCCSSSSVSSGGGCITTCAKCSSAPAIWTLTTSGFAGTVGADDCTVFNGTFTLIYEGPSGGGGGGCCWQSLPPGPVWQLCYDVGSDTWSLAGLAGALAAGTYTLSGTTFNCSATNIMNRSVTGSCSSSPATVTVAPSSSGCSSSSASTVNLSCCAGNALDTMLLMDLTGTGTCACLNGTYTMNWNGSEWITSVPTDSRICGVTTNQFAIQCIQGNFYFAMAGGTCNITGPTQMTVESCSPLELSLDSSMAGCCDGNFSVIATG